MKKKGQKKKIIKVEKKNFFDKLKDNYKKIKENPKEVLINTKSSLKSFLKINKLLVFFTFLNVLNGALLRA